MLMLPSDKELDTAPTVLQLRIFWVLSEELHFGRAAARLYMSQPALSRQLSALERRLGVQLAVRTSRVVRITEAGAALLPAILEVLHAVARLQRVSNDYSTGLSGRVVIGTVGAEAAMDHTTSILQELRAQNPSAQVELRLLDAVSQFDDLISGRVDVVFCRPPVPDGIGVHHLRSEAMVACVSALDPLSAHPLVKLVDLEDRCVVSFPDEVPRKWRDFWAVDPRPSGVPVKYGPVVRDVESMLAEVAQNSAIAFLPAAAKDLFVRPGVVYVDVEDLPLCTSAIAWLDKMENGPVVKAVQAALRKAWPHNRDTSTHLL
ncbi:LysR family transcriptional regulator [Kibdelosporangium phytohabitans]|uniref:LysR family transcriptional regulator n=1 Tax=Kibdelosporangium phytohabitans TaxID=860235 RepID=UPI0012F82CDC|nr:LysR family transcriptional regulator [Kibdelosporangium phytohabitans]MBE1470739.1 DNA-binding transcriptional LysR family regulator [Kibdelosporangium phytohabitans]